MILLYGNCPFCTKTVEVSRKKAREDEEYERKCLHCKKPLLIQHVEYIAIMEGDE